MKNPCISGKNMNSTSFHKCLSPKTPIYHLGHHNRHIVDSEQGAELLPDSPLGLLLGGALHKHHCGLGAGRPSPVHREGVSPENMRGEY